MRQATRKLRLWSRRLLVEHPTFDMLTSFLGSWFGPSFAPSAFFTVVSGSKAGVGFAEYLLAPNDAISTTSYSGDWGLGSYEGSYGWESVVVSVDSPAQNVTGSLRLSRSTAPPAWACGPGTGTNLEALITDSSTPTEIAMYKGTNWAHFAQGHAHAYVLLELLSFTLECVNAS